MYDIKFVEPQFAKNEFNFRFKAIFLMFRRTYPLVSFFVSTNLSISKYFELFFNFQSHIKSLVNKHKSVFKFV